MESEWAMFRNAISKAAVQTCDFKVTGANSGSNWWTPEVDRVIKLKEQSYNTQLASLNPKAADS